MGLGCNVVLKELDKKKYPHYISYMKSVGIDWIRLEFDVLDSKEDFSEHDKFIKLANKSGINILGLINQAVPGNIKNVFFPKFKKPFENLDLIKEKTKVLVKKYKKITHWEIWNEENIKRFWVEKPSSKDFIKFFEEIAREVKKIDKKNKIVVGGVCGNDLGGLAGSNPGFLRDVLKEIKTYDIIAFHPYFVACYASIKKKDFFIKEAKKRISAFKKEFSKYKKEMWITEFGVSKLYQLRLKPKDLGEVYRELSKYTQSNKMKLFLWVLDDFDDPKNYTKMNPEEDFGLLDPKGNSDGVL